MRWALEDLSELNGARVFPETELYWDDCGKYKFYLGWMELTHKCTQ